MKESIHSYFQVGTIQWMSYPNLDVIDALRKIGSEDYFDAVEISHFTDDAKREEAKRIIQEAHLRVCFGAQPMLLGPKLNPNDTDEAGRKKAEEKK